jgi:hypothetical protein
MDPSPRSFGFYGIGRTIRCGSPPGRFSPKRLIGMATFSDWRFHSDGIHLNSRSGLIVADLIQKFIER